MHGRLKVYTSEEQKLIKQKEQQKQLNQYREGFKKVISSRKRNGYDQDSLEICAKLLTRQPDVYTLWNYRKEATVLRLAKEEETPSADPEDLIEYLQNELNLTQQCLINNPKSYSSWYHRYWILERHPNPNWQNEIFLCGQYLQIDERNFHCWDFRRLIINKVGLPVSKEITFSTDRINVNFSNYSAWHYRSTLKFLNAATLPEELLLIESAIFTDPYDSSTWFYLRWILSHPDLSDELRGEIEKSVNQLADMEVDCKWILIAQLWFLPEGEERDDCHKRLVELDVLREGRYEKI